MTRVAALLVNPNSGRGRAGRLAAPVRDALDAAGFEVLTLLGGSAAESVALARAAVADRPDAVVALGGDGLVHCAVQAVAGTGLPLAVVPAGRGNDFAGALGVPTDPAAVAALVAAGHTVPVDAGLVCPEPGGGGEPAQRWWVTVLCAGYDSRVNERADRMRWPTGPIRYDLAILAELSGLRPRPVQLTLDGMTRDLQVTLIAVGNGPQYGGGLRICPGAEVDDGMFDVLVAAPMSRRRLIRLRPLLRSGRHVEDSVCSVYRARQVRLAGPDLVAYADGERIGPLPVTTRVVPGALRILVPER